MSNVSYSGNGIVINKDGFRILLDPHKKTNGNLVFVSHAHIDHLSKSVDNLTRVLTTSETSLIANARGYRIGESLDKIDGLKLINNGHILGSRGLLIDESIFYTSDISIRKREFLKSDPLPSVDTLIIESTFGLPFYVFPEISQIIHDVNTLISKLYNHGIPVILMGYALGKAQLLTKYFRHWEPLYIHDKVNVINCVYSSLGIQLKQCPTFSEAEKSGLLLNKPWIMIAPLMSGKSKFVRQMKQMYGAVTIGFSGWAINKGYTGRMGLDYTFPVSDHCDYNELLEVVRTCNPSKIFTFHGYAEEFASDLRKKGYNARPITYLQEKAHSNKSFVSGLDTRLDAYL